MRWWKAALEGAVQAGVGTLAKRQMSKVAALQPKFTP